MSRTWSRSRSGTQEMDSDSRLDVGFNSRVGVEVG